MNILITSGASKMAQELDGVLSAEHSVVLTDLVDLPTNNPFRKCELEADEKSDDLVSGMDAVVHLAVVPETLMAQSDDPDGLCIDYHTRRTYNLLTAAAEEGVGHVVFCSALSQFSKLDSNWTVSERWWTTPTVEAAVLGPHLGEFVCREFAHEGRLKITCLRLGTLVSSQQASDQPIDPEWLEYGDAVAACECAIQHEPSDFAVYHIQSEFPGSRFSTALARNEIGYTPRFHPGDPHGGSR